MSEHYITFNEIIRRKKTVKVVLLPCPFCGGRADFTGGTMVGVKCTECKATTPLRGGKDLAKLRAAEAWNRRTQP